MRHSHLFCIIFAAILFAACGVRNGEIRISGTYEGINQGDFPILNIEGGSGRVDTLHIIGGDFNYEAVLENEGVYCIVYPNNTQLTLWMHSGDHVTIEGNAQNLWHVEVKGNEENELYNDFRQQTEANDTTKLRQTAARIIREHPDSPVSCFLFMQYFIIPTDVPLDSINTLYKVMHDAAPEDPNVASLGGKIHLRTALRTGQKMPDFDVVTTDSVHHNLQQYRGTTLFLYFWAGWQGSSSFFHTELLRIKDNMENPASKTFTPVSILGYCLDVDKTTMEINMSEEVRKRIPTVCDFEGLNSPLVVTLGVKTIPLFIVVGPDGKIQHLFTDFEDLRRKYDKPN